MSVCIAKVASPFAGVFVCARGSVWVSVCVLRACRCAFVSTRVCTWYTHIHTEHPLFPVCRLAEVGDLEGGSKRGGARDAGGENKLISLTQPAVTPPQHDINPKPRLSLFKLYESLCRRIEKGREKRTSWEALSVFLSLSPHSFDLIFPRW